MKEIRHKRPCMTALITGCLNLAMGIFTLDGKNGKVSTQKSLDDWKDGMNLTR